MSKTYCKPFVRGVSWRSQNFGDNATVYGPHSGNDEAANVGTPVYAAGDGVIEFAGVFDNTYADNLLWLLEMGGNILVLNCGNDEPSFVYAHLSRFTVRQGARVKKGQIIAYSGNSGSATTGAHLHVECIPPGYVLNSNLLGRVNPDLYLTEYPEDYLARNAQELDFMATMNDAEKKLLLQGAKDAAFVRSELEKINTASGKVRFRDFFVQGVRAAQEARDIVKGKK